VRLPFSAGARGQCPVQPFFEELCGLGLGCFSRLPPPRCELTEPLDAALSTDTRPGWREGAAVRGFQSGRLTLSLVARAALDESEIASIASEGASVAALYAALQNDIFSGASTVSLTSSMRCG
jgi:hypothetical protein